LGGASVPPIVVDACFLAAVLTREEHSPYARERLEGFEARALLAPALVAWEIANILWKKTRRDEISAHDRDGMLDLLDSFAIDMEPPTLSQTRRALLLSDTHGLTAYDAAYLEAALRHGAEIATLDARLTGAALSEGLTVHSPFA